MAKAHLECIACGASFSTAPMFDGCPRCRDKGKIAPLEVAYERASLPSKGSPASGQGIWRWHEWLPPVADANRISMGEASTPLLPLSLEGVQPRVLLKNETVNPTWSWKDRPNCISASVARDLGFSRLFAISTGNHGNAAAAYSSRGGLECVVLVHPEAPALQLALMTGYGARVVRGGDQSAMARQLLDRGYFPSSILCPRFGYSNPYGIEGFKTIAYELVEQLAGRAPDRVFVPVGSGDGVYGIWKGFRDLRDAGRIDRMPKMIGCQAAGADSAYRAFVRHDSHLQPVETVTTAALSIGEPVAGDHAMRAVYESDGSVVALSEDAIRAASHKAARQGFAIELASSAALAGALASTGDCSETWVVIASGCAARWPETLVAGRDFSEPEYWSL